MRKQVHLEVWGHTHAQGLGTRPSPAFLLLALPEIPSSAFQFYFSLGTE